MRKFIFSNLNWCYISEKSMLWIWTTVSWGYHVLYYLEFQNGLFVTRHICESQPRHTFLLAFRALPTSEKLKLTKKKFHAESRIQFYHRVIWNPQLPLQNLMQTRKWQILQFWQRPLEAGFKSEQLSID